MVTENELERDQWHQLLGAQKERLRQLEQLTADQRERWEADATEWQTLQRHRRDLAEWLIENALDEQGQLIRPNIDAGLGGEQFIPCAITVTSKGLRYHISLFSTTYEVREAC